MARSVDLWEIGNTRHLEVRRAAGLHAQERSLGQRGEECGHELQRDDEGSKDARSGHEDHGGRTLWGRRIAVKHLDDARFIAVPGR